MANVEALEQPDEGKILRLTPEQGQIVADALAVEWLTQVDEAGTEVRSAFGGDDKREMYLSDAAWKVRRMAVITDLLEHLGWVRI